MAGSLPRDVELYCISDLHTDFAGNLQWVEALPSHGPQSAVIVAGDTTDSLPLLARTLRALQARFTDVAFVPGNHELWVRFPGRAGEASDSLDKHRRIAALCASLGVHTAPALVCGGRVLLVPLPSWYDGSLWMRAPWEPAPDAASGASPDHGWGCWRDTTLCRWPASVLRGGEAQHRSEAGGGGGGVNATESEGATDLRSLSGVVRCFHREAADNVAAALRIAADDRAAGRPAAIRVTFSHFYASRRQLRPLMEAARAIRADRNGHWPPNFTSVAGTAALQPLIDALAPAVHVCGHSHRAFDFVSSDADVASGDVGVAGVRYVNAPLAYPSERDAGLVRLPPTQNGMFRL